MIVRTLPAWLQSYVYGHSAVRASGLEPEEVLSEVVFKMLLVSRRGGIRPPPFKPTPNTLRSARYCLIDVLRSKSRANPWRGQARDRPDLQCDPDTISPELWIPMRRALAGLSPRQRDVFHRLWDGCTQREVADALGISTSTISRLVHRMREAFCGLLDP